MATTYDLALGKDPIWDASKARFAFQEEQARRDSQMRRSIAAEAADRAFRQIGEQGVSTMGRLAGNAENRGLLSSGLYEKAKADASARQGESMAEVTRRRTEEQNSSDADLTRALASMMVDRETEAGSSRARMTSAELLAAQVAAAAKARGSIASAPARRPVVYSTRPAAVAPRPAPVVARPPIYSPPASGIVRSPLRAVPI